MNHSDLAAIFSAIDRANAEDPTSIEIAGTRVPAELAYGRRMTERLDAYAPGSSASLQIAARGQHVERWTIPRKTYPECRVGYLSWRKELQRFHARRLGEIMQAHDQTPATIERVGQIVRKERLTTDPEVQCLEDVACLVFLEHYFDPFAASQTDEKLSGILARTWRKMSPRAHETVKRSGPPQRILELLAAGLAASAPR